MSFDDDAMRFDERSELSKVERRIDEIHVRLLELDVTVTVADLMRYGKWDPEKLDPREIW